MQASSDVRWGNDPRCFDGYCLRDAEAVVRVLIPARVGDAVVPWRQVLADHNREISLDGYTSWCEVTELPGDGSFVLDRAYHPAAGILPKHFCTQLLHALPPRIRDQRWHAERHDVLSAAGAVSRHHLLPPMSS